MSSKSLNSNFHPRKSNKRKVVSLGKYDLDAIGHAKEFGLNYSNPHFKLGNQVFEFDQNDGQWVKKFEEEFKNNEQDNNQFLQLENNLLKIKNDLLLDMLSEVHIVINNKKEII